MQARTFQIVTQEEELEHSAQAEVEQSPPQSLDSKRTTITEQLTQDTKRPRTSDSDSSFRVAELVAELDGEKANGVARVHTRALVQGQFPNHGWNFVLDPKGIAARCALAALNARGKTVRHPSASGVPQLNCVHMTRTHECWMHDNLFFASIATSHCAMSIDF